MLLQSQNVHRAALVYYKQAVLINHRTNRRTHALQCKSTNFSFLLFQTLTSPARARRIHFDLIHPLQRSTPPAAH